MAIASSSSSSSATIAAVSLILLMAVLIFECPTHRNGMVAAGDSEGEDEGLRIPKMYSENYTDFISGDKFVFIEFYSSADRFTSEFHPILEKQWVDNFDEYSQKCSIYKCNCATKCKDLCSSNQLEIDSYPELWVFRNGSTIVKDSQLDYPYEEEKIAASLSWFCKSARAADAPTAEALSRSDATSAVVIGGTLIKKNVTIVIAVSLLKKLLLGD